MEIGRLIAVSTQRNIEVEEPEPQDLYSVGVVGLIHRAINLPDGNLQVIIRGTGRVELTDFTQRKPYLVARVETL